MSQKKSKIWSLALPLSVIALGAAYYIKMPEVRTWVDARTPIVRNLLGRYVQEPTKTIVMQGEQDPLVAASKPKRATPAPAPAVPVPPPAIVKAPEPVATPVPPAPPKPEPAEPALSADDLQKIQSNPALWPKKVVLTKPGKFAAVLNGKIVGSLMAPEGSEANVMAIKDGKLGLEFNGGGGWLMPDQTDLATRVRPPQ